MPGRGEYRTRHDPQRSLVMSIPPLLAPQFFIGCESQKDVWGNQLRLKKKILITNMVKEEFKDFGLHDRGGLNLTVIRDTQS
jgi:hypothetical protein